MEKCLGIKRPCGFIIKDPIDDSETLCSIATSRKIIDLLEAELLEELEETKSELLKQMQCEKEAK